MVIVFLIDVLLASLFTYASKNIRSFSFLSTQKNYEIVCFIDAELLIKVPRKNAVCAAVHDTSVDNVYSLRSADGLEGRLGA